MNYKKEQDLLQYLNQLTHNTYESVNLLGELSRNIAQFYENVPFDSECLHWILYNESPQTLKDYESAILYRNVNMQYINEVLEYVAESAIKDQVRHSVFRSLKLGHLAYVYGGIKDVDMQARVRILTRQVLDSFYALADSNLEV